MASWSSFIHGRLGSKMRLSTLYYPWQCCFISTKFCDKDNKSLRHPWGILCHLLVPPVIHQCLLSNDSTDQCWAIFIFTNQNLHLNVCIRCTRIAYKQKISVPWNKWWSLPLHTDYGKSCCYCSGSQDSFPQQSQVLFLCFLLLFLMW